MAKELTIDEMRAKVAEADAAAAEQRRQEMLAPIQPVLDGVKALEEPLGALRALHTPELAHSDQDLWSRLGTFIQTGDNLRNAVTRAEQAVAPLPLPLTGNTQPDPAA